jgi:hypothetical protein
VAIQKFNVSAHIQQRRRVINLAQALRDTPARPRSATAPPAACAWATAAGNRRPSSSVSEASKNRFRTAHFAPKLSRHARAQARVNAGANHPRYCSGSLRLCGQPTRIVQNLSSHASAIAGLVYAVRFHSATALAGKSPRTPISRHGVDSSVRKRRAGDAT